MRVYCAALNSIINSDSEQYSKQGQNAVVRSDSYIRDSHTPSEQYSKQGQNAVVRSDSYIRDSHIRVVFKKNPVMYNVVKWPTIQGI